jgi:hypothetical protein
MRQVMPHRNDIVAAPDDCKSLLLKKAGRIIALGERPIGRFNWPRANNGLRKLRI